MCEVRSAFEAGWDVAERPDRIQRRLALPTVQQRQITKNQNTILLKMKIEKLIEHGIDILYHTALAAALFSFPIIAFGMARNGNDWYAMGMYILWAVVLLWRDFMLRE